MLSIFLLKVGPGPPEQEGFSAHQTWGPAAGSNCHSSSKSVFALKLATEDFSSHFPDSEFVPELVSLGGLKTSHF